MARGRPPRLTVGDQHELRRYREAGVSIRRLAGMWNLSEARVYQILRMQREKFGPEQLPDKMQNLVRLHLYRSNDQQPATQPPRPGTGAPVAPARVERQLWQGGRP